MIRAGVRLRNLRQRSSIRRRAASGMRSARLHLPLVVAFLMLLIPASLLLSSGCPSMLRALLPFSAYGGARAARYSVSTGLEGERFLWYAPHSGFSNQVGELRNAAVAAALLNRTLVVPPVLDHHAVVLGSCPKFRVSDPATLCAAVWDHTMQLLRERRANTDSGYLGQHVVDTI